MLDFGRLSEAEINSYALPGRYGPVSERIIRGLYQDMLAPGDVAIDVGVNFGIHLFEMSKCVGDRGVAFGIEANVERYGALLRKIAQGMDNVRLLNVAAANNDGFCDFYINRSYSGWSSLNEQHRRTSADVIEKVRAYAVQLSSVIPVSARPVFIKIDIEGGEFPALLGSRKLLERCSPVVVFEGDLTKSATNFNLPAEMPAQFLAELGYRVHDLFGLPIDPHDWRTKIAWNFIAFKDEPGQQERVASALNNAWSKLLVEGEHPEGNS